MTAETGLVLDFCQWVARSASDTTEMREMIADAVSLMGDASAARLADFATFLLIRGRGSFTPAASVCSRCHTVGKHQCAGLPHNPEVLL